MKTENIPARFRPQNRTRYPWHQQGLQLEDRAEKFFRSNDVETDRVYLPIKWTAYHIQNSYGKETRILKSFVDSLPKQRKYFTVVQYDDGPLVDIKNCRVFSAGGLPDSADPIPLISDEHPVVEKDKDTLASFVGSLDTHSIRMEMAEGLSGKVFIGNAGVSQFEEMMERSYFALCPRGYGKTSFRLYEAMQMGCVPVYITDKLWMPFSEYIDWSSFCLCVTVPINWDYLFCCMRDMVENGKWNVMRENAIQVYNNYFKYEQCFKMIKKILEEE